MKNYYEILSVSEEATPEEIKKAFRELAKKWHPDRNPNNKKESEEKFKEVSEAYDVLSSEEKRKNYDFKRKNGDIPDGMGFGFSDGFDGFEEQFISNFGKRHIRGPDLRIGVELTLQEVVNGCTKVIKIIRPVKCESCNGLSFFGELKSCNYCSARGYVIVEQRGEGGVFVFRTQTTCPKCYGSGYDNSCKCQKCSNGLVDKEESLEINFPKGVSNGSMMRLQGKGGESIQDTGDLYISIRIKPHPRFERSENNLTANISISLKKALLGGEVTFEDINGKTVLVSIPRACQPDTVLVLRGQGIDNGNLLLKTKIGIPTLNGADDQKVSSLLPD